MENFNCQAESGLEPPRHLRDLALNESLFKACYEGTNLNVRLTERQVNKPDLVERELPANDRAAELFMKTQAALGTTGNLYEESIRRGSGFFVSEDGLFASVVHLVEPLGKELFVWTADGEKHKAAIVARDDKNDLVLLKVEKNQEQEKFTALELGSSLDLKKGDELIALGGELPEHPLKPGKPLLSPGEFIGHVKDRQIGLSERLDYVDPERLLLKSAMRTESGNSGGPVFGSDDKVLAITDYGEMNSLDGKYAETAAIPVERLKELIYGYRKR